MSTVLIGIILRVSVDMRVQWGGADEQTYSLARVLLIPLLALCHAPSSPPELSLACQNQSQDAMLSASHAPG